MKIKNRYLYGILALFILLICIRSGKTSEATSCIYFPFIYFSIYICTVINVLKDCFNKNMLLRRKSRYSNALIYMKKIFLCAIVYSIVFICSQLVVEILLQNSIGKDLFLFYMIQLILHVVAWSMWGMLYYFIYSLTLNKIIGVVATWICCDLPTKSQSILFRPKKYVYNVFKYLIQTEIDNVYNEELLYAAKEIGLIIVIIIGILIVQKKKNYIQKI